MQPKTNFDSHDVMFSFVKVKLAGLVFFLLPKGRQVFLKKLDARLTVNLGASISYYPDILFST